jgi:hypothetical protein
LDESSHQQEFPVFETKVEKIILIYFEDRITSNGFSSQVKNKESFGTLFQSFSSSKFVFIKI